MSPSWERFLGALSGTGTVPPVAPLVAADHAAHLSHLPVSRAVQSADLLVQVLIAAQRMYQGDFVIVFADVNVEAEAMGCQLDYPDQASPFVVSHRSPEALLPAAPRRDGRLPMMIEAAERIISELSRELPVFVSIKDPFSAAALACGVEDFLCLLISAPQRARIAVQRAFDNQIRYLDELLKIGANVILGAPLASGSIVGPQHFRNFVLHPMSELLLRAKRANRLAGVHLCGDSNPLLDQLVSLPADFISLESFDVSLWKTLVKKGKSRPALMGYLPTGLLIDGDQSEIVLEVYHELESLQGYRHLLATACDVPMLAPPEKVRWFVQAGREAAVKVQIH